LFQRFVEEIAVAAEVVGVVAALDDGLHLGGPDADGAGDLLAKLGVGDDGEAPGLAVAAGGGADGGGQQAVQDLAGHGPLVEAPLAAAGGEEGQLLVGGGHAGRLTAA
jgi:hypothetical protein